MRSTLNQRNWLIFVLLFGVSIQLPAADFGVANWGMSVDDVKQQESRSNLTPFGETSYLIYEVNLSGIEKTRIVYQFKNDQLNEGRFIFEPTNKLNVAAALNHYALIKSKISSQFGPPNSDQVISTQPDEMILSPENYANELASDRLIFKSSWRSSTAAIHHQLAWKSDKPHHQLHYQPISINANSSDNNAF